MNHNEPTEYQIYHQAAEWLDKLSDGELDSLSKRRFYNWLKQSPNNQKVMTAMLVSWNSPQLTQAVNNIRQQNTFSIQHYITTKKWLVAPVLAICVLALSVNFWQVQPIQDVETQYQFVTQIAQNKTSVLNDGSVIDVGADSQLDVSLQQDIRLIKLKQGLAYFSVAKDKTRPFQVNIGAARVVAVGTEFHVERNRNFTLVSVYEGAVEVRAAENGHTSLLKAGERIKIANNQLSDIETFEHIVDWRYGWLELNNEPLGYLVEHLNRYSDKPIVIAPKLEKIRVAGRFPFKQTQQSLAMLTQAYVLSLNSESDYIYLTPNNEQQSVEN
ncbi:FecR domain-containing protein [Catenovulum sp. 2E275]|uniref:FecR family protein n=1 Tax=Catenovulum sp. 2E275 TaxID=2980497 RepID=UPI0021CF364F|nr:FecR domain-containing protein [Catenovulum sp. 2E275]MCU4675178.1 FecR domain-containing protein [Catenovulum sp. 2E275]